MIKKAVIPAAGYGTRILPATKTIPKELFPIIDTPTIQYIVEEAIAAGIEEILIITSANKNSIIDYFDRNIELEVQLSAKNRQEELKIVKDVANLATIHFVRQKEQLGLGHAILQAETFVGKEPFAVLLGDDLFVGKIPAIKELVLAYNEVKSSVIGTMKVKKEETGRYGICEPKKEIRTGFYELKGVVEKPQPKEAPSQSAIAGRYLLTPEIFTLLRNQEKGVNNEIQLTDSILKLMEYQAVYSYDLKAKRYDIGSRVGYFEALIDFAIKRDDLKEEIIQILKNKIKDL
jgi:UTP--glucose-1-phosphate uridylyltransferase